MKLVRWSALLPILALLTGCTLDSNIQQLSTLLEETVDPVLTVNTLPVVNAANQTSVPVSGTCTPEKAVFSIVAPVPQTGIICVNGLWSTTVDFSTEVDGAVSLGLLTIGNSSYDANGLKDTLEPQNVQMTLNSGVSPTNSTTIDVEITGTDIHEVYLTENVDCISGGTWTSYQQMMSWTLSSGDGIKTIYLTSRDENGNTTLCQNQTITLDTAAPTIPTYIPAPKLSDNFVFVNDVLSVQNGNAVYDCSMSSAASCTRLPPYSDNGIFAKIYDAKKLLDGDIVAVGTINDGGNKALVIRYNKSTATWTEIDRYAPANVPGSEAHAVAVSSSGSVAVIMSANTSSGQALITRELLHGHTSWTTDTFSIGGSIGSGTDIAYYNDKLYVIGDLWGTDMKSNSFLRERTSDGVWSTIDTYRYSTFETSFKSFDFHGDKIFITGWVGTSTRQGFLRECTISSQSCVNLDISHAGVDTYPSRIATANGNDLYFTASTSPMYSLFHFDIAANTKSTVHNFTPDANWSASGIELGFASDGRMWGMGRYYEGTSDTYRPFVIFYSSSGAILESHVYP